MKEPQILGKMNIDLFGSHYHVNLILASYTDGNPALIMNEVETEDPFATLSVNIPDVPLEEGYFIIKNYSENEDIYNQLVSRGILVPTTQVIPSGYCSLPVCKLNLDALPKNRIEKI